MMKITGIKKAVGEYRRCNEGGYYSPRYGRMMLDRATGEVWVDEFYSIGHNSWKEYHDESIINIVNWAYDNGYAEEPVNMANVKIWAEKACELWAE